MFERTPVADRGEAPTVTAAGEKHIFQGFFPYASSRGSNEPTLSSPENKAGKAKIYAE